MKEKHKLTIGILLSIALMILFGSCGEPGSVRQAGIATESSGFTAPEGWPFPVVEMRSRMNDSTR